MKKKYSAEENIIRYKANIKVATILYTFAGVLCSLYILRYFISENFAVFFRLAFPDMFLKLGDSGEISFTLGAVLAFISLVIYFLPGVFLSKKHSLFPLVIFIYVADTACLLFCDLLLWSKPDIPDLLIDVFCHLWALLFLIVGLKSARKLKESQRPRAEGRHAPDEALQ